MVGRSKSSPIGKKTSMNRNFINSLGYSMTLLLAGCASEEAPPADVDRELALGVQLVTEGEDAEHIENRWSGVSDTYLGHISAEEYQGTSFVRVRRDYDITDVDQDAPEQILRVSTEHDSEEFSSMDALRKLGSSHSSDYGYAVDLEFRAELSSSPTPGNGILEIDADADQVLDVEWTYPAEDDKIEVSFTLIDEE